MGLWEFCIALYASTTLFAVVMTYREQRSRGQSSLIFGAIGFLACTIWPVVAAACLFSGRQRLH